MSPDDDSASKSASDQFEARLREWVAADLAEIAGTCMPFGKYGPTNFPPRGKPLYDLPLEYLLWFSRKGFPKGRLGELLRILFQLKTDGCEEIFDHFRRRRQ